MAPTDPRQARRADQGDDSTGGPDGGDGGSNGDSGAGSERARPRWRDRRGRWRRGLVLAAAAVLCALLLVVHSRVPNTVGHLGSLLQTFLPWTGLAVPVLLIGALLRRSVTALVALVLPTALWFDLFGGLLLDKTGDGDGLTVVSHNVDAENPEHRQTARDLAATEAELVAVQELPRRHQDLYAEELASTYPHHTVQGTVALWSRYPLDDVRPVDTGMGWTRALRATADTPDGPLAVYVAHLPSVRVQFRAGFTANQRDEAADLLAHEVADDPVDRLMVLGDLNGTMNDRALAPLTSQLRSTQGAAGAGFGFTFPAGFPMTRIDQILVRGVEPVASWSLPATGSDHLPVAARVAVD